MLRFQKKIQTTKRFIISSLWGHPCTKPCIEMSWSQCAYKQCAQELLQILGDKNNERSVDWSNIWKSRHFHSSPRWWRFRKFLGEFLTWLSRENGSLSGSIRWTWNQRPKTPQDMKFQKESKRFCFLYTYDFHSFFYPRLLLVQLRDETIHASGPFAAEGHFFCSKTTCGFPRYKHVAGGLHLKSGRKTRSFGNFHLRCNQCQSFWSKEWFNQLCLFSASWMFMNAGGSHLDGPEALGFQNDDTKISMQTANNIKQL